MALPYFIATKFEAYKGRDEPDLRISHDIEDIFIVLDGIVDFTLLERAPVSVKQYLQEQFILIMNDVDFVEAVSHHVGRNGGPYRIKRIINFITGFTSS